MFLIELKTLIKGTKIIFTVINITWNSIFCKEKQKIFSL